MGGAGIFAGLLGGFTGSQIEDEKRVYSEKLAQIQNNQALFQHIVSDPTMSDEARALAMKGLYVTMNQQPSQLMGGGMFPGKKGKPDPAQQIREQLSNFPIESKPERPPAKIPPVPQATAQGSLPTATRGAPSSLGPIPIMGQAPPSVAPMTVPGIAPTTGLFKSPSDIAIEAGKAKLAGAEAITGPLDEQEKARLAGVLPSIKNQRIIIDDPANPGTPKIAAFDPIHKTITDMDTGDLIPNAKLWQKPSTRTFERWYTEPKSSTGFASEVKDAQGNVLSVNMDRLPPSGYLPTEGTDIVGIPDPDDPTKIRYQAIPRVSRKVLPSGGATNQVQAGATQNAPPQPKKRGPLGTVPTVPPPVAAHETSPKLPGKTLGTGGIKVTPKEVDDLFKPAMDADARLRIMEDNLANGLKGDQQAMVSLVANHVAMVMGMPRGKVPRISYQFLKEAETASPILGRIQARFGPDGYLSGVVLTPDQMRYMVSLGKNARQVEWDSANSRADAMGIKNKPQTIYKENQASEESLPEGTIRRSRKTGKEEVLRGGQWQAR